MNQDRRRHQQVRDQQLRGLHGHDRVHLLLILQRRDDLYASVSFALISLTTRVLG